MSVEQLQAVRSQVLPMLHFVVREYQGRVPPGYPVVIDQPEQGLVGLELDPSYALYLTSDGEQLVADIYRRSPRTDNRSSASRQKHAGVPFYDRRVLETPVADQTVRNLIAELMSFWNQQPGIIHISDS